jgi:hypothetical protein
MLLLNSISITMNIAKIGVQFSNEGNGSRRERLKQMKSQI